MPNRPRVVVFDVVETLMSLEPLRHRFSEVGAPPELLERWFDRLLRDGMALTLAGDYEPFPKVATTPSSTSWPDSPSCQRIPTSNRRCDCSPSTTSA